MTDPTGDPCSRLESDPSNWRGGVCVDEACVARFIERSAYEAARTEPPDGFPKLPDLLSGWRDLP